MFRFMTWKLCKFCNSLDHPAFYISRAASSKIFLVAKKDLDDEHTKLNLLPNFFVIIVLVLDLCCNKNTHT